jgi:hypothetical protein
MNSSASHYQRKGCAIASSAPADEAPAEVNYFLAGRTFLQKGRMM